MLRLAARAWLPVVLLCAAVPAAASLRLAVDGDGLSQAELAASRALVDRALVALPAGFHAPPGRDLMLRWRDDLPPGVHGRARGDVIGLRRTLLADWMARDPAAGAGDPAARAALAALLHELAHVHERRSPAPLSRQARLLDLAGWPVQPLRLGRRARRNDLRERSPDPYERTSPAEFVAVNFEHFLLDPGYACRRPALHRLLEAHFGAPPGPRADCAEALPLVAGGDSGAALRLLALDPARVHAIDYLLAEPDARPMSRWGHSMLRVVACAPGRPPGPDCRLDLDHHLVLSFRAFVDDVQVSNWRGLTGAYPSRLFILPLGQVLDEYTRVELRGLRSIPLRLDPGEIASLLERAAQVHWSYDGRYRFVGNNCAVETWKLLNDGVPRLDGPELRSITPTGLLRRLERAGVADASVLDDPDAALREGYRFESLAAHFDAMFAVAATALALPAGDARDWFALDPAQRRPWLSRGDLRATAALLVLEQAALRRDEAQAREALKRRFLRGAEGTDALAARVRELLADGAWAGRPALLLAGDGYGLPQAPELERLAAAVELDDARLRKLRDDLYREAREWLPAEARARLEGVESNLVSLGERLRQLAP